MISNGWSMLALPALTVIFLTAFFGLNDVRADGRRKAFSLPWMIDMGLGVSFLATSFGSFMMLVATAMGANIYTWRGALMMWGIAGIFALVGKFAPWRRWIRRLADLDKAWAQARRPTAKDLAELVAEGRRAIVLGPSECVRVLPKLVQAIELLAARQAEMDGIRGDLIDTLQGLRRQARGSDQLTPEASARVHEILDRLERTIQNA